MGLRCAWDGHDLVASADAFNVFTVVLAEHPSIFDKKPLFRSTARADKPKSAFQRNNPGLIFEGFGLVHVSSLPRTIKA
jgi:hypothetical protein